MHDDNMGEFTMADTDQSNRPLSPHLTIYRPQLTSVSSIVIRITGNALIFCVFLNARNLKNRAPVEAEAQFLQNCISRAR